jgi:hypothetical protein
LNSALFPWMPIFYEWEQKYKVRHSPSTHIVGVIKLIWTKCVGSAEDRIRVKKFGRKQKQTFWGSHCRWKVKVKIVPVLNQLNSVPWKRMGGWRYSFTILDLGTRWRWVVSFPPLPLYSRGNRPR